MLEAFEHEYHTQIARGKATVTDTDISEYIDHEDRLFDQLTSQVMVRSFPPLPTNRDVSITTEAIGALIQTLIHGYILKDEEETGSGAHQCYVHGWLHSEELPDGSVILVFPSRLHQK